MTDDEHGHPQPPAPPTDWVELVRECADAWFERLASQEDGVFRRNGITAVSRSRLLAPGVLAFDITTSDLWATRERARPPATHTVVNDLRHHYAGTRPNDPSTIGHDVVSQVINYRDLRWDGTVWR